MVATSMRLIGFRRVSRRSHPRTACGTRISWSIVRRIGFIIMAIFAPALGAPLVAHAQQLRPAGFVDAVTVVPNLLIEMRYAGTHNFVGKRIDGYEAPVCLLSREAAAALAAVARDLAPRGLGLKVYDCYRPARAIAHFA